MNTQKHTATKSIPITWSKRGVKLSMTDCESALGSGETFTRLTCIGWQTLDIRPRLTESEKELIATALDGQPCGIENTQRLIESALKQAGE